MIVFKCTRAYAQGYTLVKFNWSCINNITNNDNV